MANGEERLVVLDAGPIIHLDELQCLRLLAGFQALYIPSAVWQEIVHHRPELTLAQIPQAAILDPATALPPRLASAPDTAQLHPGEIAALALLLELENGLFLSDDDAARQMAESLGFEVTGTLGILLRGVRREQITREQAARIVRDIRSHSTLHVSRNLLERLLRILAGA